MFPDVALVALMVDATRFSGHVLPIPPLPVSDTVPAVAVPAPLVVPAGVMVSVPGPAHVVPVSVMFPAVTVLSVMALLVPVVTDVPMVSPPHDTDVFFSVTAPLIVDTVPKLTAPVPDSLNVIVPVLPATVSDRLVTVAAEPSALFSTMFPDVALVALMVDATRFSGHVLPIPPAPVSDTVPAVAVPAPLIVPADVMVSVPEPAPVVPVSVMFPAVTVLSVMALLVPVVTDVPIVSPPHDTDVFFSVTAPLIVDTVPKLTAPVPDSLNVIVPV